MGSWQRDSGFCLHHHTEWVGKREGAHFHTNKNVDFMLVISLVQFFFFFFWLKALRKFCAESFLFSYPALGLHSPRFLPFFALTHTAVIAAKTTGLGL